jgi:lipoprotein-releasing system permease protein
MKSRKLTACVLPNHRRTSFVYFDDKQEVTYLKGVDANFSTVNDIRKKIIYGQWVEPNTYQVVVGYGIAQKFSMGLLDFNNQLEVLVPKPEKEI